MSFPSLFSTEEEEKLQGWQLRQFLPEDETLFSFDDDLVPSLEVSSAWSPREREPEEDIAAKHYRLILARNRQKILNAQKFLVRKRVELHQAYLHKLQLLEAPFLALGLNELMVVKTPRGFSVRDVSGKEAIVSLGHVMTGFEWGVEYMLDAATFSPNERRNYLDRLYRHRIALLDREAELLELLVDAYKDESPSMAEAIKSYRDRYRAAFDIETGTPHNSPLSGLALGEKLVRSWLTNLNYDFSQFNFSVRPAHPFEEIAYGVQVVLTRMPAGGGKERTVLLSMAPMPEAMQALGSMVSEPRGVAKLRADHEDITSQSWLEKMTRYRHNEDQVVHLYLNPDDFMSCYHTWTEEESLFAKATAGPYRFFDRSFWMSLSTAALQNLLAPSELQDIVSKI
jgi:hypothetical protein